MNRLIPSTWLRPAPLSFELERFLDGFLTQGSRRAGASARADGSPAVNVRETPDAYAVELELPGLALQDVEVVIEGRDLTVRGERKSTLPDGATWQRRERFHGKFERQIRFPVDVDGTRVQARLEHGVLAVTCPKSEAAKARRISIAAANGKELQ